MHTVLLHPYLTPLTPAAVLLPASCFVFHVVSPRHLPDSDILLPSMCSASTPLPPRHPHPRPIDQAGARPDDLIPGLISAALGSCDVDMRQVLLGNIVLAGGGSLLSGFADRLSAELTRNVPHVRTLSARIHLLLQSH